MRILVINGGSSSVKFALLDAENGESRLRGVALLAHLGLQLDAERNAVHGRGANGVITRPGPPVALVVSTDEELLIARESEAALQ
jgi:acetate kinase